MSGKCRRGILRLRCWLILFDATCSLSSRRLQRDLRRGYPLTQPPAAQPPRFEHVKNDPVKLHYDCEGVYVCIVSNMRGSRDGLGDDGFIITHRSDPAVVLVGDPPYLLTRVTMDYRAKRRIKRKRWPHYASLHGYFSYGTRGGGGGGAMDALSDLHRTPPSPLPLADPPPAHTHNPHPSISHRRHTVATPQARSVVTWSFGTTTATCTPGPTSRSAGSTTRA